MKYFTWGDLQILSIFTDMASRPGHLRLLLLVFLVWLGSIFVLLALLPGLGGRGVGAIAFLLGAGTYLLGRWRGMGN